MASPASAEAAPDGSNAAAGANATPTSNGGTDERPSDSSQPSSKKRRSNIQLNKDDHPEGQPCNSDDDDDLNDEGGKRSDAFKRAPEDVLKKRKIVKASTKWSSGGNGGTVGGGAFASVRLAPAAKENSEKDTDTPSAVFGSGAKVPTFGSAAEAGSSSGGAATSKPGGFGSGFGAVSSGFGALKPSSFAEKGESNSGEANSSQSNVTAFGGGFSAVHTGFGSLKSSGTSFGFGSAPNDNPAPSPSGTAGTSNGSGLAGTFAKSPGKSSNASPSQFPTSSVVDTANGEQDEDCVCQVRAKLFKMVPEDETSAADEDGSALKGDVPSVPSTSGRMELVKKKEIIEGSLEKTDEKSPEKSKDATESGGEEGKRPKLIQKEAGIGPVRILKTKSPILLEGGKGGDEKHPASARVVQRQETSGGQATRVILNIRLVPKTCNVIRRGEKFVQLNAPASDGALESSLFKVKTTEDADTLEKKLKAMLELAGGEKA